MVQYYGTQPGALSKKVFTETFLCLLFNMSNDEEADLQRQKALRGGNRSVVTKVEREVYVITRESVNDTPIANLNARLNSVKQILEEKLRYLKLLYEKILSSCPTPEIEKEVEETSDWETRVIETLNRIKEFYKGNYSPPTNSSTSANNLDAVITHGEISYPTISASPFHASERLNSPQKWISLAWTK